MAKVLFLIAQDGFRDEEFFEPKEILEENDFEVTVASIEKGKAKGKLGAVVDVDVSIKDADINDYDALVIAGGPGALALKEEKRVIEIIRETIETGKILAAICIAPVILAEAGVLEGVEATVWNEDGKQAEKLKNLGAKFVQLPVVADSNIITGNGPEAAQEFGLRLAAKLSQ